MLAIVEKPPEFFARVNSLWRHIGSTSSVICLPVTVLRRQRCRREDAGRTAAFLYARAGTFLSAAMLKPDQICAATCGNAERLALALWLPGPHSPLEPRHLKICVQRESKGRGGARTPLTRVSPAANLWFAAQDRRHRSRMTPDPTWRVGG